MITNIEDYFTLGCGRCERFATPDCSTRPWAAGLLALRALCRDMGLEETLRWGHPCYRHAGRNIALIGAFRQDFRLSFLNASLLSNRDGLLEKQGPNTQHSDMIRFTDNAQVAQKQAGIRACLQQAMDCAQQGIRPVREARDIALPEELVDALDADPVLAEAFHQLTPGRQRSYVIHLEAAKKPATRTARILACRERILAGKGAQEY